MLTVEEYILQMKKKDKLDEFNFRNHAENMSKVISYVMEYFNNYLNLEAYDYENIKTEQTLLKIRHEVEADLPKSKEFIIQYYLKAKTRIDRLLKNTLKDIKYIELFYLYNDYEKVVTEFCNSSKMRNTGIEQYKDDLIILAEEIKKKQTEKPSISNFKFLDNGLVSWIQETYRKYGVNLYEFAENITWNYYEKYVERIYNRITEVSSYINHYNHRYNENAFGIEDIYKDNLHRIFIEGRKGELEMLLMHDWLLNTIHDSEYWPEYVNLCVATGRVSMVQNMNILLPVINKGVVYPTDIKSKLVYVISTDGLLKSDLSSSYIIRLAYNNDSDSIWKDAQMMSLVTDNLSATFKKYGNPYVLELMAPFRSQTYNEEEFFIQYQRLEKNMKKYTGMKIAIVNGPSAGRNKPHYLMESIDDIIRIRHIIREMKFKLKLIIDISKLANKSNFSRNNFEDIFSKLKEIRNLIIGIHITGTLTGPRIYERMYKDDKEYLNKFDYPQNSDLVDCLSTCLNDNQRRYFVPDDVKNSDALEELIDNLLRGGFSFDYQEG
ncbi:hypothetical protein G9F72_019330 [Clostridium estertheticum]|uniref:hypothetical protein n=1 Tax=Clostridium estertheticum TaxID=238834 RepID=UPI0013E95658|nr:hypothetical protein [Clostridium estertheticum]MBZ9688485.1 hypothetical protein [Clostridium estertheticum]